MDHLTRALNFSSADVKMRGSNPNDAESAPTPSNDIARTKKLYEANPTEENGQAVVKALRLCGHHDEADFFAKTNLKKKPKFTIEGY